MAGIPPRARCPGTDVFAAPGGFFVVRSDLGCFLQAPACDAPGTPRALHPACRGGEHYVGDAAAGGAAVCILRGGSFRRAPDLGAPPGPEDFPLHPACRGGDHYASWGGRFAVVFLARGAVLAVADLATGAEAEETALAPADARGLYYYGSPGAGRLAFLAPAPPGGLCSHLCSGPGPRAVIPVHPAVAGFLPGGLAWVRGRAFGAWERVGLLQNETDEPLPGAHELTRKVGQVEEKWADWAADESPAPPGLPAALLRAQFALPPAYGGLGLRTEQEEWEAVAEEGEELRVILQPRQKLYWWQYVLGLGQRPLLFCRGLRVTRGPAPPAAVPLPSSEAWGAGV